MVRAEHTVWITGASSGIGAALARVAAAEGCWVVVSARRRDLLEALAGALPNPERVLVLPLDVTDAAARAAAAEAAWAWRGGVDLLVNNAGVTQRATALETSEETTRQIMEVSFFAAVGLSRALLPKMIARGRGRVAFVSSVAGYVATPLRSSYAAAKHAVRAWADGARAELAGTGVGVTTVCPGYIATGISKVALTGDGQSTGRLEPTDERGMDVDEAARRIWRDLGKGKAEILVGGPEVYAIHAQRFFPALVRRLAPRFAPKAGREE